MQHPTLAEPNEGRNPTGLITRWLADQHPDCAGLPLASCAARHYGGNTERPSTPPQSFGRATDHRREIVHLPQRMDAITLVPTPSPEEPRMFTAASEHGADPPPGPPLGDRAPGHGFLTWGDLPPPNGKPYGKPHKPHQPPHQPGPPPTTG